MTAVDERTELDVDLSTTVPCGYLRREDCPEPAVWRMTLRHDPAPEGDPACCTVPVCERHRRLDDEREVMAALRGMPMLCAPHRREIRTIWTPL